MFILAFCQLSVAVRFHRRFDLRFEILAPGSEIILGDRDLYRFRLHRNHKIESTVNTQPFSFSTRPSTVNSQQSTVNNSGMSATGIDITSYCTVAGGCGTITAPVSPVTKKIV
ncbi:MAG: hypothetical protein WBA89_16950, partial [Microcoleus sp.]|uniref:hypothetical protein n=1 Tax=Microcoleus sp. TaxID=44472 RepID=UPI003C734A90